MDYRFEKEDNGSFTLFCPQCGEAGLSVMPPQLAKKDKFSCPKCRHQYSPADIYFKSKIVACTGCGYVHDEDRAHVGADSFDCPKCGRRVHLAPALSPSDLFRKR